MSKIVSAMTKVLVGVFILMAMPAFADTWDPPCDGDKCKIYVLSVAKEQERFQIGPAYISHNGVGGLELSFAGQTTGPTLNEPKYDLDFELYHWRQDPDEEHSHFHLVATSYTPGTSKELIFFPATAGLYQIRGIKRSGYAGSALVFVKF